MQDRLPTQVLENGAIRYEEFNSNSVSQGYKYLKLADEPLVEGTPLNKAFFDDLARLQFTDTEVAAAAFVADTTYEDFPYRAAIALTGVTANMTPEVVLGVTEAISGSYAPVSECYDGGVYIYASEAPEAAITIPTIICWKAVG